MTTLQSHPFLGLAVSNLKIISCCLYTPTSKPFSMIQVRFGNKGSNQEINLGAEKKQQQAFLNLTYIKGYIKCVFFYFNSMQL